MQNRCRTIAHSFVKCKNEEHSSRIYQRLQCLVVKLFINQCSSFKIVSTVRHEQFGVVLTVELLCA